MQLKTQNIVLETAKHKIKSFFLERMERELDQPEDGKNVGEIIVLNKCISLLVLKCYKAVLFVHCLFLKL